jgi:tRNA A-37 threonylcarbamoyl transferase component Bud32
MAHREPDKVPPAPPSAGAGRSLQTQVGGVEGTGAKLCPVCEARYPEHFNACTRDGTALVEIDETVGTILSGTYFVRRVLGEGAMGRVFEARHTRLPGKRFAIKMLHPEYVREPQILARFAREAEAAATIEHPNVAGVVDVDRTADGRPFLVSELLQGKELGEYLLETGKMPAASAVRVTLQIANALAAAHARGIIHRDLKPENIFLTGDVAAPVAKVLDFGMARLERGERKALTQAGAVIGTPSFMPPEQARGETVDHRADIYAVGGILYATLTGQRPHDKESPAATLLAVLTDEPPRPRSLEPSIPEGVERVILRAMAREPSERYASMEALALALAHFDGGAPLLPSLGRPAQTLRDSPDERLVAKAHIALSVLLGVTVGWAAAALAAAFGALVQAVHSTGDSLSGGEAAMVVAIVVIALAPPLFLAVQAMRTGTWQSPHQAAAIVQRAAPHVIGVLVAYGACSAAIRGLETLVGHGRWLASDGVLLLLGLLGAGLPVLLSRELGAKPMARPRRTFVK